MVEIREYFDCLKPDKTFPFKIRKNRNENRRITKKSEVMRTRWAPVGFLGKRYFKTWMWKASRIILAYRCLAFVLSRTEF